jgi:hypothetical protein
LFLGLGASIPAFDWVDDHRPDSDDRSTLVDERAAQHIPVALGHEPRGIAFVLSR